MQRHETESGTDWAEERESEGVWKGKWRSPGTTDVFHNTLAWNGLSLYMVADELYFLNRNCEYKSVWCVLDDAKGRP
jgi:hypothetical protein